MKRPGSPKSAIVRLLDAASAPVYLLDAQQTIVFANQAVGQWQQIDASDLLGLKCRYQSMEAGGSYAASVANCLCPPPDLASRGGTTTMRLPSLASGGRTESMRFFVLFGQDEAPVATLAIGGDESNPQTATSELDARRLHECLGELRQQLRSVFAIDITAGTSAMARRLQQQSELAQHTLVNTLIVGERGSGRERLARAIHRGTESSEWTPLVPLDCRLLDAELLQSTVTSFLQSCAELDTPGIPALLLLDVDAMPEDAQRELSEILAIDELGIRVFSTSQESLHVLAFQQRFRADLAEQLSAFMIPLPPLRERRADLSMLLQLAAEKLGNELEKPVSGFSTRAMELLITYDWPRGFGELFEIVESVVRNAANPTLDVADLPLVIREYGSPTTVRTSAVSLQPLDEFLLDAERRYIQQAMTRAKGNKAKAARLLSMSRARLMRRIEQLRIE